MDLACAPHGAAPLSVAVRVAPASDEHREGLLALLGEVSNGCFCGWWHHDGDDYEWQARCNLEPDLNRKTFGEALAAGDDRARGVVALDGDRLVGWLKLAPATRMGKLYGRRVYRTLSCFDGDRDGIYVIGCVMVAPDRRRQGIAHALVRGAVEIARGWGARAIEATPRRPREAVRDDEHWLGPPSVFEEAGFAEIDGPEPYPVMRIELDGPER